MAHRLRTTMMKKEERLFYLLLYILFLLDTFAAFIDFLVCMYVIVVLSTISNRYYQAQQALLLYSLF